MVSRMTIPYIVMLVLLYLLFARLERIDTFNPLTIPAILGTPFYIFMLRYFFLTIPMELEEAAIIDRAGNLRVDSFGQVDDLPLGAALARLIGQPRPLPETGSS